MTMKALHKRLLAGFAIILTLIGFCIVGTGFYLLDYSLLPDPNRCDTDSAYADLYSRYPSMEEWVENHPLQEISILNPEGKRLQALYHQAEAEGGKTAIIVHGYRDCNIKFLYLARMYNELGFHVLLPDLAAHGQSQGEAIQMGWKDADDLLLWCGVADSLFSTELQETHILVHGVSMGAATVMNCSGRDVPAGVKGFVADCGYTSVWDEFAKQLQAQFGLPTFPIMNIASLLCEWKYGWNFQEAAPIESLRKSRLPMLFIHGTADDFVPTRMVHELYDAKPADKKLWLAPDAGHGLSYLYHPEEYTARIRTFCHDVME